MSPWALLLMSALLLVLPRIYLRQRQSIRGTEPRHEVRGFLRVLEAVNLFYCRFWHRLTFEGKLPLPSSGPAILISNHTCGIDHLLLQATTDRLLGFMIAKEYYDWTWINWICRYIGCIPVKRDGQDFSAMRSALHALKEGRVVPIFPEGHITPASGRRLDEIKPGCAYLALHARVPVVPAYITGTPETDDIIKAIVTPSKARVIFGHPIDLSDVQPERGTDKSALAEASARFRTALLALRARALATESESGG